MTRRSIISLVLFCLAAATLIGGFGFYFANGIHALSSNSATLIDSFTVSEVTFGGDGSNIYFSPSPGLIIAMALHITISVLFIVTFFFKRWYMFISITLLTIVTVILYMLAPLLISVSGGQTFSLAFGFPMLILMLFLGYIMFLVGYIIKPSQDN